MNLEERIFKIAPQDFSRLALDIFQFQYQNNSLYRQFCDLLHKDPENINAIAEIPFLPVAFFKTHSVKTTEFTAEKIFESSGTTQTINSQHHVKDIVLYRQSFMQIYRHFYGSPADKCILGLLPGYLERQNSSLVMMADELMKAGGNKWNGFYLYDLEKLQQTLMHNELLKQPTLLLGVTHALLDFAEKYPMQLRHTIVMETGGMKGRREEWTRQQVHAFLQKQLGINLVHAEYGMTELLSQAYSKGDGIFHCPPWMRVVLREEDDPLQIIDSDDLKEKTLNGVINVIDLANIYSCSFIATDDMGRLHPNDSFEVLGRLDNSDIRGCSLMAL